MNLGHIVLNGVTEQQLIILLQEKEHKLGISFSIAGLQQGQTASAQGQPPITVYGNATIGWQNDGGLKEVLEVVHKLLHHKP